MYGQKSVGLRMCYVLRRSENTKQDPRYTGLKIPVMDVASSPALPPTWCKTVTRHHELPQNTYAAVLLDGRLSGYRQVHNH